MVVTYMQVHTKIYGSNEFACGCNWAFIGYNLTLKQFLFKKAFK